MLYVTLALFLILVTLWLLWRRQKVNFFKSRNIPGPPPSILFGNFWEILIKGQTQCQKEWIKKYGKVLGYFYGLRPILVIADTDLLKQIEQKDFHKFTNRPRIFDVGDNSGEYNEHALTHVRDKKWKDIRSIITPTFTTSKLKMMFSIVRKSVDELVEAIDKNADGGKLFNIYPLYQNLTMDVISRTSLGMHTNAQTDPKAPFVRMARALFSIEMSLLLLFAFCFPELSFISAAWRRFILALRNEGTHPRKELRDNTHAVISARKRDSKLRRNDLLQLMMDAQRTNSNVTDKDLTASEHDDQSSNDSSQSNENKLGLKMTDEEVAQNATLFLLAGYETTSTALVFATHLLAHHPDVQEKVRQEVNEHVTEHEDGITYETVQKLQYLDQVLNESLRIYPPIVFFVNREAAEDIEYGKWKIPKGTAIQAPVYYLHHDPTLWDEPEVFNPERFSSEEKKNLKPMAFQPFGSGPRNCVGMRFALMEAKLALAKILQKYRLMPKQGSLEKDLEISLTAVTMRPRKGVYVQAEKL